MAPETLKRSVIVLDISELRVKDSRVSDCNRRPTHLVGIKNKGSMSSEKTVICHDKINIVIPTNKRLTTLLTRPERVEVNACCAPITSELILEISAPV